MGALTLLALFCNLDTENLMMCCLDSLDALKVSIEPVEVVRFISAGFASMNERQIFDRSKAVFEYFKLPFDAEPPAM